jgi:UDP-N-acetylmuramate--alanine ligase
MGITPRKFAPTIGAIRDSWKRPLTVIFQPHRFTRTRDLFDDFLTAFEGADRLVLTEIYPAGEDPIAGATGEALYQAIKRKGHWNWNSWRTKTRLPCRSPGSSIRVTWC